MFYAIDEDQNRIFIDDADKQNKYYCPCCNSSVIVRRGPIYAHHFAHSIGSMCDANYSEKTKWHREWQERFPEECREVVVSDLLGCKRIADVKIDGITIEFQKSSIPKEVFDSRNRHHSSVSRQCIWIFDSMEKEIEFIDEAREINGSYSEDKGWYSWSYPNRLLAQYSYHLYGKTNVLKDKATGELFKNVVVFLQVDPDTLVQIVYVDPEYSSMKWFLGKVISTDEFVGRVWKDYQTPIQLSMNI